MKCLFLTFFLFFSCTISINAQRYQFKKYKTEEGLVNNETFAIIQDSQNRIWVSSTGGISCFNGKTFKNFTTDEGLASNIVFSIFEDSKGRIWAGTLDNGISIIENGKITNPTGVDFNFLGSATKILEGVDGTIYLIFLNGIVTYKNGKLDYLLKGTEDNQIAGLQYAAWYDSNTIFLASLKKGIFKMTLNPLNIENIYNEKDGVNNICYSVFVDSKKDVWVGAYGELYQISQGKLNKFRFKPEDFDNNRIYGIYGENENELYLSFEGNGFGIFNKQTGDLRTINESQGLPTKYIYRMIKDTEGNHWMTSFGEGIIRFRDTAFKIYDKTQGLPSVNAVAEWNNKLTIASDEGLLMMDATGKISPVIKGDAVKTLFVTPENNMLFNTNRAVFELLETSANPTLIDEGDYNQLFKAKEKTYLFGTDNIKILAKDSTYFINTRRSISIKPIGDRYILCKLGGLFQMDETGTDTIPGLHPKVHFDFRSLDAINENEVLAGSEKNLYHISLDRGIFKIRKFNLDRFTGLKHFRALKVDGNNLWLAGRDMLLKVDLNLLLKKDTIKAEKFNTTANFLENHIDLNSLLITGDKTVLATSLSGILAFNEKAYIPNTQPPKLAISEILLFSEPLADSLYRTKNGIVLPYQKNYLSFSMEAITFTNPENVYYQYRMRGLRDGDEWSLPTKDPNVVFSYLPPGDYSFEFRADNGNGVWQTAPYEYSFKISVPFWKTWFFWVFLIFGTSIAVFLFYYYKNQAERKRNEAFTHNLIKAQEEERTRVARELHDSVGQKLMLLTKKTKSTGNQEMEFLATNTLQELRSISKGLHPATLERLGPTVAIRNMVDEVDSNTSIFFTHEIEDIDALLSKEASLHLYRIIQEVLNNMVKHAEAKAASITIEKKKNSIEAIISDNGIGFEFSEKVKTSDSLGMKTILERAKILHSKIDIKSQINKGTTVTLTIPLINA
ncbi:two-component regulator propeller domain-containing protein [Aequorivita sp. SDUM287046]|uniref:histidine kinase n=1 Tax=Aequorivita aurantiaca TaxID=3053356 RepID=A0ABT8DIB9_9FLAO|nr:sensor histidine kinase [Aequorivita aurantiaca]MDN3722855.1 two-component regulator propeller domain-containing protein [Aequorivita aurantiaca]